MAFLGVFICATIFSAADAWGALLQNGILSVSVDSIVGLSSLKDWESGASLVFSNDDFSIAIAGLSAPLTKENSALLSFVISNQSVALAYKPIGSGDFSYTVTYTLLDGWRFVTKSIVLEPSNVNASATVVAALQPFWQLQLASPSVSSSYVAPGCQGQHALFLRLQNESFGVFLAVQNPFGAFSWDGANATAGYSAGVPVTDGGFAGEAGVLGSYGLGAGRVPGSELYIDERNALTACATEFLMEPAPHVVKVHVGWDSNDYQIDIATDHGQTEYQRIIDRDASLNISHIILAPSNSNTSSRANATDDWGWEETLWLGLGEHIRQGRWYPGRDPLPEDVATMLSYAAARGVKLMAYVYPTLGFTANSTWLYPCGSHQCSSLANPTYQQWLLDTLIAFIEETGLGGFAWDYGIYGDPAATEYAQWRGWNYVLTQLRAKFPDIVMDHRQSAHCYGPWGWLTGSYAEPIAGDENPETYGIMVPGLHTDAVAADNMRAVNWWYRNAMFAPTRRIPGFLFHQTERSTDDGELAFFDYNTRDFDLLGYRYSLFSNIATAAANVVFTNVPARDPMEFLHLPQADIDFINDWMQWTDENLDLLATTVTWSVPPAFGVVDGTAAIVGNAGFIFAFNPNYVQMNASILLDSSVGFVDSPAGVQFQIVEIYPQNRAIYPPVDYGQPLVYSLDGVSAVVLQVQPWKPSGSLTVYNVNNATALLGGTELQVVASGELGVAVEIVVSADGATAVDNVTVNGVDAPFTRDDNGYVRTAGRFGSELYFGHSNEVNPTQISTGSVTGQFTIPAYVFSQLSARVQDYPIPWSARDLEASWLAPARLLLFAQFVSPDDSWSVGATVNGTTWPVQLAYETRRVVSNRFNGFYLDLSDLMPETFYEVTVNFPAQATKQFVGLFFENIETSFSTDFIPD